jgi:hypothetical protein
MSSSGVCALLVKNRKKAAEVVNDGGAKRKLSAAATAQNKENVEIVSVQHWTPNYDEQKISLVIKNDAKWWVFFQNTVASFEALEPDRKLFPEILFYRVLSSPSMVASYDVSKKKFVSTSRTEWQNFTKACDGHRSRASLVSADLILKHFASSKIESFFCDYTLDTISLASKQVSGDLDTAASNKVRVAVNDSDDEDVDEEVNNNSADEDEEEEADLDIDDDADIDIDDLDEDDDLDDDVLDEDDEDFLSDDDMNF